MACRAGLGRVSSCDPLVAAPSCLLNLCPPTECVAVQASRSTAGAAGPVGSSARGHWTNASSTSPAQPAVSQHDPPSRAWQSRPCLSVCQTLFPVLGRHTTVGNSSFASVGATGSERALLRIWLCACRSGGGSYTCRQRRDSHYRPYANIARLRSWKGDAGCCTLNSIADSETVTVYWMTAARVGYFERCCDGLHLRGWIQYCFCPRCRYHKGE